MMRRLPRPRFIMVLLVLTLGLSVVLTNQALRAAQSHRETVVSLLRDYAGAAASELTQRAALYLDYQARSAVSQVGFFVAQRGPHGALPTPAELRTGGIGRDAARMGPVRGVFRLDPSGDAQDFTGDVDSAGQAWVATTVRGHAASDFDEEDEYALLLTPTERGGGLVLYGMYESKEGALQIYGVVASDDFVTEPLAPIKSGGSLLPRSLLGGMALDSIGSVRVVGGGREWISIGGEVPDPQPYQDSFVGYDTLPSRLGGLTTTAVLHPIRAPEAIVGELPRIPGLSLFGALLLTAVVVVAAIVLLRREYELARMRSDFVSSVSHELRTPLAQVRMFAETLLLGRVRSPGEERRSIEIIDQEARRLTHLVENLLHFSRSERQVTRITKEPTDLGALVETVAEGFAPLAAAQHAKLRVTVQGTLMARVDPAATQQMLLNLLDNALKYGPMGQTVTIATSIAGDRVRLFVDDQGQGIPPTDRERVWQRFWRRDRERESAVAGTGIGLAVVRELSELHGGRTWVEEVPGGGARFVVELPEAWVETPEAQREVAKAPASGVRDE